MPDRLLWERFSLMRLRQVPNWRLEKFPEKLLFDRSSTLNDCGKSGISPDKRLLERSRIEKFVQSNEGDDGPVLLISKLPEILLYDKFSEFRFRQLEREYFNIDESEIWL